ncbi:MAG TPA: glycoside hydrolase family 19 protein [Myxococcaceae bacterium]|jgi:putative chitinase
MPISLTPSQLKAICPEAPASATLPLNLVLARTGSVTHLRAAMLIAQLAAASHRFRQLEEADGRSRPSAPYFGRGWIRLTGRKQYRLSGAALGLDLLRHPELATTHNVELTAWAWNAQQLHRFSDVGDVEGCARALAGAAASPDRLTLTRALYERACTVLAGSHELIAA